MTNLRDTYLRRFVTFLDQYLKSPIEEERKAAEFVSDKVSRFRGLMGYEMKIVEKLNALAIIAPTADSDACIERMNVIIKDYALTIANMRSGGSGNEGLPKQNKE